MSSKSTTLTLTTYDIGANVLTEIMSWNVADYRSAKLYIQGSANAEHQMSELSVIQDNTFLYIRETNQSYTQDPFITFSGTIANNNAVSIMANTSLPNTDFVIYGIMMEVANRSAADSTISQDKILDAAAAMKGLYPDDTTDYVALQTGSLDKEHLVANMDREIRDGLEIMNRPEFAALSTAEQQAFIENLADVINTRSADLQAAIDADIAAIQEVDQKIEAAGLVGGIQSSYADPDAKKLLDKTLNSSVREAIQ